MNVPVGATRLIRLAGQRFLGGEVTSGQCDLIGERAAAEVQLRPLLRRTKAARGLGQMEFRSGLGDDQVAVQHHAQSEAENVAVDGGDDRLPVDRLHQQIAGVGAVALRAAQTLELLAGAKLALVHVGAAAKRPAAAAQDRDMRLGVGVELRETRSSIDARPRR